MFTGKTYADGNLNIRALPHIKGKKLGYFKDGEPVDVKQVMGDWMGNKLKVKRVGYPFVSQVSTNSDHAL